LFWINVRRFIKGVTVIELMISVAILAVIISLAVPLYTGSRIRSSVTECINGATGTQFAITEYRLTYGQWPPDLEVTGTGNTPSSQHCNPPGNYQKETGAFTVDVNEPAISFELVNIAPRMTPIISTGHAVRWKCTPGETEPKEIAYLPANCRND